MNKENILMLADHIETLEHFPETPDWGKNLPDKTFNMGCYTDMCGTPACIAGWAAWFADGKPKIVKYNNGFHNVRHRAALWLELDIGWTYQHLFEPFNLTNDFSILTPAMAARALRKIVEIGPSYNVYVARDIWPRLKPQHMDAAS